MAHRNARLTVHGRRLLVERIRGEGQPIAHVAKAMGVSRQCAHRWVARFDAEGDAGLEDRSSRLCRCRRAPAPTSRLRWWRLGSSIVAVRTGWAPSSVSPPARCHASCDATTCRGWSSWTRSPGTVIRASKTTAVRYERDRPGELVHMDVKKIGRIPTVAGVQRRRMLSAPQLTS